MGEVLLNECRFAYLQGPLADWWREREVALERGIRSKPGSAKTGAAPLGSPEMAQEVAPPLPSHQQQKYQEQPYAPPGAGTWGPGQSYGGRGAGGKGRKGKGRSVLDGKFLKDKWAQWGLILSWGLSLGRSALHQGKGGKQPQQKGKSQLQPGFGSGPCWFCNGPHNLVQCHKWVQAGRPDLGKGGGQGKGEPHAKRAKGAGKAGK